MSTQPKRLLIPLKKELHDFFIWKFDIFKQKISLLKYSRVLRFSSGYSAAFWISSTESSHY